MARDARADARRAVRRGRGSLAPAPVRAGLRLGLPGPLRSRGSPPGHRPRRGARAPGRRWGRGRRGRAFAAGGGRSRSRSRGGGRRAGPRAARDGPSPPARGGRAHVPLQALPPRGAGAPLGLAPDAREHGPSGRGRAPPRAARPRGRTRGVAPRLRAPPARRHGRRGPRRGGGGVQGVLRPGLVRRGGGRRLQPPRPRSRPRLAGDRHAPRLREVPPPDPLRPHPVLYRGHPERQPGSRRRPGAPVPRPLRSGGGGSGGGGGARRSAVPGRRCRAPGGRPRLRDRGADPPGARGGREP